MEAFSPNLSEIPGPALNLVLKELNYESIQNLGRVCRSLRHQIQFSKFESKLTNIDVSIVKHRFLRMQLQFQDETILVYYEQNEKACLVKVMDSEEDEPRRSRQYENEDFAAILASDLGHVLSHQKSTLDSFSINIPNEPFELPSMNLINELNVIPDLPDERSPFKCLPRFLSKLECYLKLRNKLLETKEFVLEEVHQPDQIIDLLPYFNPESIEKIGLGAKHVINMYPDSEYVRVMQLEHWNNAKEIQIENMMIPVPLNWFHRYIGEWETRFEIRTVSPNDLIALREAIFQWPSFKFLCFKYAVMTDEERFVELFGGPYDQRVKWTKTWYYDLPQTDEQKAVRLTWHSGNRMFEFYCLNIEYVPEDALD